ncbi:mitochondrial ubiquitin ligase activator of nfkb 1-A [Betta splendens]|uniref:RING-type E3 ubiquitin transferase n=1 Tax=Betta splendens TaxID=158456 RepID=A0A6P7L560_BETSP|nr:mitochondrial ubiquitin ligase activator of nfkb 1-A [Betta splendens]XP_028988310.1 mitochondrial ubiquitin ligase activator of nfkb 1-A [Betta splendens]
MSDLSLNSLIWIGVGSSFACSGLFYYLYREKNKEFNKLKEIPIFKPDQQLVKILKSSPHKRLLYVAVEGMVQADAEPLTSQFVPQCFGVIQKTTMQENWQYWNSLSKTWNTQTINKKETSNTVPFSLVSPGAYIGDLYVKVHKPLEASGCYLERVFRKVKHAEEGFVNVVLQGLSGKKPAKIEESEELLRVGSTLTGFGEVVLEGGQVMRLQAPQDGRKYILVPTDYRSFIERHEKSASMWMKLTAITGLTGISLLAGVMYNLFGTHGDRTKKA